LGFTVETILFCAKATGKNKSQIEQVINTDLQFIDNLQAETLSFTALDTDSVDSGYVSKISGSNLELVPATLDMQKACSTTPIENAFASNQHHT